MEQLFQQFVNAFEAFFSGMIGVIDAFGDGGRFVTGIVLLILALIAHRFMRGNWSELFFAFLIATGAFTLLRAIGATNWLAMVVGTGLLGWAMFGLMKRAYQTKAWFWVGGAALIAASALFAEISFFSVGVPDVEIQRNLAKAGRGLSNFIGNFFEAAQDGARQTKRNG